MHPQGLVVWATGVVTKPVVRQFIERFAIPPPSPSYKRRQTGEFEWGGVGPFFSVKVGRFHQKQGAWEEAQAGFLINNNDALFIPPPLLPVCWGGGMSGLCLEVINPNACPPSSLAQTIRRSQH